MKTTIHAVALATALGSLTVSTSGALAAAGLPPVHKAGGVEYLSGGIGQEESKAIERSEKQWPLTLEFAAKGKPHDEFVANVKVVVRDAKGHPELQAKSDGPFLLAKLPPGQYAVDATFDGKTLHDKVLVKQGAPARAVLVWPAGAAKASS